MNSNLYQELADRRHKHAIERTAYREAWAIAAFCAFTIVFIVYKLSQ